MNKIMRFGIPGLIIAIVVLYFAGSKMISSAVKLGIEEVAPRILGVSVTVESVSISPFSGSGGIKGLVVGNPEGYKTEKAFSFGEVYVNVAPTSLLSGIAHVEEITVKEPEFIYEKKLTGSNIGDLLKKLEGDGSEEAEPEADEADAGEPMKFKIDKVAVEDGSISLAALGATVPLPLPSVTLEGIGEDGGVPADEAIGEVLGVVFGGVTEAIAAAPGAILEGGGQVLEGGGKALEGITDGLKGLFGK